LSHIRPRIRPLCKIFTHIYIVHCTVKTGTIAGIQYKMLSSYTSVFCCPAGRDGGQWRVVDICPWWGITPVLLGHIYPSCPGLLFTICTRAALCIPQPCSSKPDIKSESYRRHKQTFQLIMRFKKCVAPVLES
jgi:hypothetical protein